VLSSEGGALLLVAVPSGVVDGVVEPDRQFGVGGVFQLAADGLQLVQHRIDMLQGVIVPTRLLMPLDKVGQDRGRVGGQSRLAPRCRKSV
jgi:hypothetical protein